jgi:hypothetical protein
MHSDTHLSVVEGAPTLILTGKFQKNVCFTYMENFTFPYCILNYKCIQIIHPEQSLQMSACYSVMYLKPCVYCRHSQQEFNQQTVES